VFPVDEGASVTDEARELLPCPFCGGTPEMEDREWLRVMCRDCYAKTHGFAFKVDAVKAWNRRSRPQPSDEARELLREALAAIEEIHTDQCSAWCGYRELRQKMRAFLSRPQPEGEQKEEKNEKDSTDAGV
jgi:Lar family restriction alleviation protein